MADERPAAGKRFNEVRDAVQAANRRGGEPTLFQRNGSASERSSSRPDVAGVATAPWASPSDHPDDRAPQGDHGRLGFSATEGPEIEDTLHNFVALNIPEDHPARIRSIIFIWRRLEHMQSIPPRDAMLLRSQTSTVPDPRDGIAATTTANHLAWTRYRPDAADATHFPMFHQMEGLWIDRRVTMAHLKSVLRMFATSYLGGDVQIPFRLRFFPSPNQASKSIIFGMISGLSFGGAGWWTLTSCKPLVMTRKPFSGFAFGLGVERLCMRRFGITDIRDLFRSDVRFLRQF